MILQETKSGILSGNHLKLIAASSMLLDHMGVVLFPGALWLRILGRLAYPIFAFMIAEGCRYTRHKLRYFLMVLGLGLGCQSVYYLFSGDTYLNILLTFSVSILLIYLLGWIVDRAGEGGWWRSATGPLLFLGAVAAVWVLCQKLTIDYGFWGILVPVWVSLPLKEGETEKYRICFLGVGLLCLALSYGGIQWYGLLALPLLLLYSGKRGKRNMKYFFYIFYPVHLALLQGIAMLLS